MPKKQKRTTYQRYLWREQQRRRRYGDWRAHWERLGGKCRDCGSTTELEFHVIDGQLTLLCMPCFYGNEHYEARGNGVKFPRYLEDLQPPYEVRPVGRPRKEAACKRH